MKKFFGNFLILISLLLVSLAAVPWNNTAQWGFSIPILESNEMYIKAGIGAFTLIVGLIFLFVANAEKRNYGHVNRNTARAAFVPMYLFAISMMVFGGLINYYIYLLNATTTNLLIFGFFGIVALNLIIFGHFFADAYRTESNGRRIAHFFLLLELMAIAGGLTFWFYLYKLTSYSAMGSYYFILIAPLAIVLYIIHIIVSKVHQKRHSELEALEDEIDGIRDQYPQASSQSDTKKSKKRDGKEHQVVTAREGKKTMIVSNQQTIVSGEQNLDPTNMIYEDVSVDPEFNKTHASGNQPNSIEYYIEKPKMFKPLDPSFDELVAYVRELPHVVTKLDDERITFYVDRKPFLVLMNFGNYYRLAFKYDLEKGIRLIIKYPTISKNKSTRDELWFKANNYGDIPKEVIYQIVKTSYDNVNA